jgi:hypothetical protein
LNRSQKKNVYDNLATVVCSLVYEGSAHMIFRHELKNYGKLSTNNGIFIRGSFHKVFFRGDVPSEFHQTETCLYGLNSIWRFK